MQAFRWLWGCVGLVLTMTLALPDAAAERRMALVIGNGDYAVGPLDNPARDAALMADVLVEAGFEVRHVTDLGYRALQRAVVGFGRDLGGAGEDTVGLVYYAGHAIQANGENYLVPTDAELQDALDLDIQTLQVSVLMRGLESAGNRLNLVILDACRNNPFKSVSRSGSRGLAKTDAPYGTLLAYSTAPGDVAADGTGTNSPYTMALARAMRTPGLPVEQVFKRVRIDVMERTGNRQVPWESSSLTGDFFFFEPTPEPVVAAPAPAPQNDSATEIAFWTTIANSEDPTQFRSYLDAYPTGAFKALAEQRIAALESAQTQRAQAAARKAQEAEAAAHWSAVEATDDPTLLQTVIDRYPDTVYAQLAAVKIEALQARQVAAAAPAAAPPAADNGQADRLFWETIQNSTNPADYQAYLTRFPDGVFAAIAQDRAANGYQPQVAALTTGHPYDGVWKLTWTVVGRYRGGPWCGNGEMGSTEIDFRNGEGEADIKSNYHRAAQVFGTIGMNGTLRVRLRVPGWQTGGRKFEMQLDPTGGTLEMLNSRACHARFDVKRVR